MLRGGWWGRWVGWGRRGWGWVVRVVVVVAVLHVVVAVVLVMLVTVKWRARRLCAFRRSVGRSWGRQ